MKLCFALGALALAFAPLRSLVQSSPGAQSPTCADSLACCEHDRTLAASWAWPAPYENVTVITGSMEHPLVLGPTGYIALEGEDGDGDGGDPTVLPLECGEWRSFFLDYTTVSRHAGPGTREEALADAIEGVKLHLLSVADVSCPGCPIPDACKVKLVTLDANWNTYYQCENVTEWSVAEYSGAFMVGCGSCP